jgi:hypothetical protein
MVVGRLEAESTRVVAKIGEQGALVGRPEMAGGIAGGKTERELVN